MTEVARAQPDRPFRLFPTCKFVDGIAFSAVYDLERRTLYRFARPYSDVIALAAEPGGFRIADFGALSEVARSNLDQAISLMREHELGDFFDEVSAACLLPLAEGWSSPATIENAIIDVDEMLHDWVAIFEQLNQVQCNAVQIRSFSSRLTPDALGEALAAAAGTTVAHIEVLARFSPDFERV